MYLRCPKCGESGFERVSRKWWMRLVPGSCFFKCYLCGHPVLFGFGRTPSVTPTKPTRDSDKRYVKVDGVVYGPASLQDVQSWAEGGRLHGDHQLSPDGTAWKPAKTIPRLDLTWEVRTPEGDSLILNPTAIRKLDREGAIPHNARVTDLTPGKTMSFIAAREAILRAETAAS